MRSRRKANMVAQGDGNSALEADPRIPPNQKKKVDSPIVGGTTDKPCVVGTSDGGACVVEAWDGAEVEVGRAAGGIRGRKK